MGTQDGICIHCGIRHERKTEKGRYRYYCSSVCQAHSRREWAEANRIKSNRVKLELPPVYRQPKRPESTLKNKANLIYKIIGKYNFIWIKDGWVAEHRIIFEKHLGRKLMKGEIIHHRNGDKLDNRLENLQLLTTKTHSSGIETKHSEDIHKLLMEIERLELNIK